MRFNRKAAQRAITVSCLNMTAIPFGLAFEYTAPDGQRRLGTRQSFSTALRLDGYANCSNLDDYCSVRFTPNSAAGYSNASRYVLHHELAPGLKPRSLKKHELRKQARDLRRMKQHG
jgi:hypothetical protein